MSEKINGIMETTMEKLKSMATADTIVGETIELADGIKVIPISKVSYGFASGGSDFPTKSQRAIFGGGGGAGMSVTPVAFLVLADGKVDIIPVKTETSSSEGIVAMIPEIAEKLKATFSKNKNKETESEE